MGRHKKPMKGIQCFWNLAKYKCEKDIVLAFDGKVIKCLERPYKRIIWPLKLSVGLAERPEIILPTGRYIVIETTTGLIIAGATEAEIAIRLAMTLILRTDPRKLSEVLRTVPKNAVEVNPEEFWMAYLQFLAALK